MSEKSQNQLLQLIPECGTFTENIIMGRNTSVILGEHFDDFIKSEIDSGRFKSASEIIRTGLRLLEDEKQKIRLINEALIVGEMSGEAIEFNNEEFKRKMKRKLRANA